MPGDVVILRPARADAQAVYYGAAWGRQWADGYELWPEAFDGARPMGVACVDPSDGRIIMGDSGGGVYRTADGALGGIIVAAEDDPRGDIWCGSQQRVLVEWVP